MIFDLQTLAILVACAAVYILLLPAHWRQSALLVVSIIALYAFQPQLPIRFAGFILPTIILALTTAVWWITAPPTQSPQDRLRDNRQTIIILFSTLTLLASTRYWPVAYRPLFNRPPSLPFFFAGLAIAIVIFALFLYGTKAKPHNRLSVGFGLIVILFILLKSTPLATAVALFWRSLAQQDTTLASPLDWQMVGYSYIAFRLIHLLRERQTGQLPAISLHEAITYTIFFPTLIAGPIDRIERFQIDWQSLPQLSQLDPQRLTESGRRITLGLGQKFILADTLAQGASLTPQLATQATHTGWLWLLLYGYAFRLYFDFAGYSNIALGIGQLFGIHLPDNFNNPYRQTSITTFWQSWHITLSNWARFYLFSPLSRSLLRRKPRPSLILIVLITQLATMILIGLWHGITINFLIWGIWHGLGLFIHKQWADRTRKWSRELKTRPTAYQLWAVFTWFLTFHYVVLGWVWFLSPSFSSAIQTFGRLLGFG